MWGCVACGEVVGVCTPVVPRRVCLGSSGIMVGGRQVHTLTGHSGYMRVVAFSPNGNLVARVSANERVEIWDTATGNLVSSVVGVCQVW